MSNQEKFQKKLGQLGKKFAKIDGGTDIPGGLFHEALRQICSDEGEWEEAFEIAEKYIKTLEAYNKYLEGKLEKSSKK